MWTYNGNISRHTSAVQLNISVTEGRSNTKMGGYLIKKQTDIISIILHSSVFLIYPYSLPPRHF